VAIAAVLALRSMARTRLVEPTPLGELVEVTPETERQLLHQHIVVYRLDGALFFGAVQRFLTDLAEVGDVEVLILRMPDLQMLDATGAQALGELVEDLEHRRVTVLIKGPRPEHERVLRAVGALDRLSSEHHLFSDLDAAVAHARLHVSRRSGEPV
jgi:SulP family sulfate permease